MAEALSLRPPATFEVEPGRVVVVHADGSRDIYSTGAAREWLAAMSLAVSRAERLERETPHRSVTRLRRAAPSGKAGAL